MLNWEHLERSLPAFQASWNGAEDVRHVVIEEFLAPGHVETLRADFRVLDAKLKGDMTKKHKHVRGKAGTTHDKLPATHKAYFDEINSARMLDYISRLTGITPVYADPELFGGGPHGIRSSGYLNVHTDFNHHPKTLKHRRLNILLYLNPRWEEEWNGQIELWKPDLTRPLLRLAPLANRVLIFETSEHSFHGHPHPLRTPPDVIRCSFAAYYYSEWPDGLEKRSQTNYQLVPHQWAAMVGEIAALGVEAAGLDAEALVGALETRFQTRDVRTATHMLKGMCERSGLPLSTWPAPFRAVADEFYKGNVEEASVLEALKDRFPRPAIRFTWKRLRNLRSAVTVGEAYRETAAGDLRIRA